MMQQQGIPMMTQQMPQQLLQPQGMPMLGPGVPMMTPLMQHPAMMMPQQGMPTGMPMMVAATGHEGIYELWIMDCGRHGQGP